MTLPPILPLSKDRRQYPFPDEHRWIEGESASIDLIKGGEGSFKVLSVKLLYGGTGQFYVAYADGFYAATLVKSPLVLARDVQTETLEASKKITSLDIETQTLEALQKITSKDIETQTLEVTETAEIGNLSLEGNSITATNKNGNVELYPSKEEGSTGKIILGFISLFQDEFSSSTKKISFLNIGDDEQKTKRGITLSDNVISTVLQNDPLVLSPNGSGEVQSTADFRVTSGKSLILENGNKSDSVSLTYTESLKNFLLYTWPEPDSFTIPVLKTLYLMDAGGGEFTWDTFWNEFVFPLVPGPTTTVGPYLSYEDGDPRKLTFKTTEVKYGDEPDIPEFTDIGPYLTTEGLSANTKLKWDSITVSRTWVEVVSKEAALKIQNQERFKP